MLQHALDSEDRDRKRTELDNRVDIGQREMELAEKQAERIPAENAKSSTIVSPNG